MTKSKEPIRLRQRRTSTGLTSLYLDIYLNGQRSYEYLKLYLIPEKTRADKEKNRTTLLLAETIRAKRLVELRNGEYGFKSQGKLKVLFYPYYQSLCDNYPKGGGARQDWNASLAHLKAYDGNERLTFSGITAQWIQGYKSYLEKARSRRTDENCLLSNNTRWVYFSKLRACLNKAYEEGIITDNPMRGIGGFKKESGTRMYLTIDEVRKLSQTEGSR